MFSVIYLHIFITFFNCLLKITEYLRLERTSGVHVIQLTCSSRVI